MNWKLILAGAAAGALVRRGVDVALDRHPDLARVLGVPAHALYKSAETIEGLDVSRPETWLKVVANALAPRPVPPKDELSKPIPAAVTALLKKQGWIVGALDGGSRDIWGQVWSDSWSVVHNVRGLGAYETQRVTANYWLLLHKGRAADVGWLMEDGEDPLKCTGRAGFISSRWVCPVAGQHVPGRVYLTDPSMLTRAELHELAWPAEHACRRMECVTVNGSLSWHPARSTKHQTLSFIGPELIHRARWTKMLRAKRPYNVMLFGPPGCGKTTIVRQWFQEESVRVLEISAASLSLGAGSVQDLLWHKADVWLVEDFDRLGEQDTGKLLWLFEHSAQDVNDDPLACRPMIFASSNHPARVADAFWRPGRFDQIIEIRPPTDAAHAELSLAQMAARHGLDWEAMEHARRDAARMCMERHSMAHVEAYFARLAEDPTAVDGPGDRTFDPPVTLRAALEVRNA